jgi:hypothetical protein
VLLVLALDVGRIPVKICTHDCSFNKKADKPCQKNDCPFPWRYILPNLMWLIIVCL